MAGNNLRVNKGRSSNWTHRENMALFRLWHKYRDDLIKLKFNSRIHNDIANILARYGFQRSPKEIGLKIKNLKAIYRNEKINLKRNGETRSQWTYFKLVDDIIGRNPQHNISCTCTDELVSTPETIHQDHQADAFETHILELGDQEINYDVIEQETTASHSSPVHSTAALDPDLNVTEESVCSNSEISKSERKDSDLHKSNGPIILSVKSLNSVSDLNALLTKNVAGSDKNSNLILKINSVVPNNKTISKNKANSANDNDANNLNLSMNKKGDHIDKTGSCNETNNDNLDLTSPNSVASKQNKLFSFATDDYPCLTQTLESVKDIFQKSNSKALKAASDSADEFFGRYVGATLANIPESANKDAAKMKIMELLTKLKNYD